MRYAEKLTVEPTETAALPVAVARTVNLPTLPPALPASVQGTHHTAGVPFSLFSLPFVAVQPVFPLLSCLVGSLSHLWNKASLTTVVLL